MASYDNYGHFYKFPTAELPKQFTLPKTITNENGIIINGNLYAPCYYATDNANGTNKNIILEHNNFNSNFAFSSNTIFFILRLPIKKYAYEIGMLSTETYTYVPIAYNFSNYKIKFSISSATYNITVDENYDVYNRTESSYKNEELNGVTVTYGTTWNEAESRIPTRDYANKIYDWFEKSGYSYSSFKLLYDGFRNGYYSGSCKNYQFITLNSTFPIFDINDYTSLKKYLERGIDSIIDGSSTPVNGDDIKIQLSDEKFNTDWYCYVTNTKNVTPKNIIITWHTQLFDTENINKLYGKVFFYNENNEQIYSCPYNQGKVTLDLISDIPKQIPENGYIIRFKVFYDNFSSSTCFIKILNSTPFEEYGIYNIDDGSTVTILYNQNPNIDTDYDGNNEVTDENIINGGTSGASSAYNALNMLTTTYVISTTNLRRFASLLWNDSFMENIKLLNNSPIENVVSCKMFPISVTGQETDIICGNVTMTDCKGGVINNNYHHVIGSITIPSYYNSFLDYSPFTSLEIFLPYIGFKELDTSIFMGKTLRVEYIHDLITGACKAMIFANDIYYTSFDGISGIDIPITASNRAQVETGYIGGALGAIPQLLTLDFSALAKNALSTATQQYHYQTQGSYSPACGAYESHLCYIIFNRPSVQYPKSYKHDFGMPCMITQTLGNLTGFTKCCDNIDLTGVTSTNEEKELIKQLLTTGVYL